MQKQDYTHIFTIKYLVSNTRPSELPFIPCMYQLTLSSHFSMGHWLFQVSPVYPQAHTALSWQMALTPLLWKESNSSLRSLSAFHPLPLRLYKYVPLFFLLQGFFGRGFSPVFFFFKANPSMLITWVLNKYILNLQMKVQMERENDRNMLFSC